MRNQPTKLKYYSQNIKPVMTGHDLLNLMLFQTCIAYFLLQNTKAERMLATKMFLSIKWKSTVTKTETILKISYFIFYRTKPYWFGTT